MRLYPVGVIREGFTENFKFQVFFEHEDIFDEHKRGWGNRRNDTKRKHKACSEMWSSLVGAHNCKGTEWIKPGKVSWGQTAGTLQWLDPRSNTEPFS